LWAVCLLLALLAAGTVWAAATQTLSFSGYAVRNPQLSLELADPFLRDTRVGETIGLNGAKNELNFYVVLIEPGDRRVIDFRVANTGGLPARLQGVTATNPPPGSGVIVTWPEADALLLSGEISPWYEIVVEWDPNAFAAPSGTVPFSAGIAYTQSSN